MVSVELPQKLPCSLSGLLENIWRKKSLQSILNQALKDSESDGPKMTLFDLLCLGIGTTVGSGVFVLTGDVFPQTGASASVSWVLAGAVCFLSALSFMELSARLPTKGSTFMFSYHALGEVAAVVASLCLTLEYAVSGAGVARNWGDKVVSLWPNVAAWGRVYYPFGATYSEKDTHVRTDDYYVDLIGASLQLLIVVVVTVGLSLGKRLVNVITLIKIMLVVILIVAGFIGSSVNVFDSVETFFPTGFQGTVRGTSLLFFGFVGFDEVCCLASKSENPSKTMPRAIAGTLMGAALASTLAQLALTVMVPWEGIHMVKPSFENAFASRGWTVVHNITGLGELFVMPVIVLASFLPQPELMASMSEERLLPAIFHCQNQRGNYVWGAIISGFVAIFMSLCVPFTILWDMISVGTLLGFNLTNSSLIMMRCSGVSKDVSTSMPQTYVWKLLLALWIFGPIGSYGLWLDVFVPIMSDRLEDISPVPVLIASVCFMMALIIIVAIGAAPRETSPSDTFQAWGVPYTTGCGILINFMLMANFSFATHRNLFIMLLMFLVSYACYRLSMKTEARDVDKLQIKV
jgi:amino acid transporter